MHDLQRYAEGFVEEHNVPAISIALWRDGELVEGAAGVLNLDTGVEATTDSVFQIGSITKIMTASLIMRLVEQERICLDDPVVKHLRDFELADRKAAKIITIRQLLNHTNGIAGDYFWDDAKSEGPHLARFIDRCSQLPLVHPPGDGFSYSNVAFALAGRLAEVVTGRSWECLAEEEIFAPLEMTHAFCRPADLIKFRPALGHIATGDDKDKWRTSSGKFLCFGQAPAGTTPTMRPADLIRFARAYMEGDALSEVFLTAASREAMQSPSAQIPGPGGEVEAGIGLGWFLNRHVPSDTRFFGHTGATNGQCGVLRIFPEKNAAFVALMNCQDPKVFLALALALTEMAADIKIRPLYETAKPLDISPEEVGRYAGRFTAYAGDYVIMAKDNRLVVGWSDAVDEEADQTKTYRYIGDNAFMMCDEKGALINGGVPLQFLAPDQSAAPQHLMCGVRMYHRVS